VSYVHDTQKEENMQDKRKVCCRGLIKKNSTIIARIKQYLIEKNKKKRENIAYFSVKDWYKILNTEQIIENT